MLINNRTETVENNTAHGLPPLPWDGSYGTHHVELPDLRLGRLLLAPADEALRKKRSQVYFDAMPDKARTRLRLGMHDRFEEYLFADGCLHPEDRHGHERHVPMRVKIVRLRDHTVRTGETWDLTAEHKAWPGLHFREELYLYVHVDRLFVEPGARLQVRGNVFVLQCDEIVLLPAGKADDPARPGLGISILGTDHTAFSSVRRGPSQSGAAGRNGTNGAHADGIRLYPSPFGPIAERTGGALQGGDGEDATDGGNGTDGENGGMAMVADLRLGKLTGFGEKSLEVTVQAGAGTCGGNGGKGGDGGHGGNGACGLPQIPGGRGGRGGSGGHGGGGGNGGHGGLCSNIFITLPEAFAPCLLITALPSEGGNGGSAGRGGKGGIPGAGDPFIAGNEALPAAGRDGQDGRPGRNGRSRPAATVHVHTYSSTNSLHSKINSHERQYG